MLSFISNIHFRKPCISVSWLIQPSAWFGLLLVLLLSASGRLIGQTVGALYMGGSGDGHVDNQVTLTLNGQSLTILYGGGSGDGFDRQSLLLTLNGDNLDLLYGGGSGDGFDRLTVAQTLDGGVLTLLYGGGSGDGFDRMTETLTLAGNDLAILYGGGRGDGFDRLTNTLSLNGAPLTILYGGGSGDGFDNETTNRTLAGDDLAILYGGGSGDGFSSLRVDGNLFSLPLTLILFEAQPFEKYVLLRWVTEDEVDTDYFTIEKTRNGTDFTNVATLEAAGYSEPGERLHYETRDENPYEGLSYYRLVTTDFDGTISLSQLEQVQYSTANAWDFIAFPNPNAGEELSLLAKGAEAGEELTLTVHDANGRRVLTHAFTHETDVAERINLRHRLPAGSYLLRVQRPNGEYQAKLLIVGGR